MGDSTLSTDARADGRNADQLRNIRFQNGIAPYATGSTLIEWGNTRVICGVTVEESVPRWMKEQNVARRLDHGGIFDAPLLHAATQTARHLQREN